MTCRSLCVDSGLMRPAAPSMSGQSSRRCLAAHSSRIHGCRPLSSDKVVWTMRYRWELISNWDVLCPTLMNLGLLLNAPMKIVQIYNSQQGAILVDASRMIENLFQVPSIKFFFDNFWVELCHLWYEGKNIMCAICKKQYNVCQLQLFSSDWPIFWSKNKPKIPLNSLSRKSKRF